MSTPPLLALHGIHKHFGPRPDWLESIGIRLGWLPPPARVHALDGIDVDIAAGEVLGLVGESGSGKSTLGRVAAGLLPPDRGMRLWHGKEIEATPIAANGIQMVFQDPSASLNPRMRVAELIAEAPRTHGLITRSEQADYVAELLRQVGLDPGAASRFPHQFSGGQRARIGIARALAVKPELLICDEPVAALDVSVQAQVLNLFGELRSRLGLTYLFISHDLGVVRHISDRVVIMYLGRVVETATTDEIFAHPHHPYAQALIAELPKAAGQKRNYQPIKGEIPSPLHPPSGCHFHPRCPHARPECKVDQPPLREITPGHWSACILDQSDSR